MNALRAIENAVCRRVGWLLLVVFIFWCFAIFRVCRVDGSADQRMFCSSSVCFVSRLSLVAIESRLCSSCSRLTVLLASAAYKTTVPAAVGDVAWLLPAFGSCLFTGPIYKTYNDLSRRYLKFIVRST